MSRISAIDPGPSAIGHRPSKKPTEAPLGTGIFDVDQAVLDYIVDHIEVTAERH